MSKFNSMKVAAKATGVLVAAKAHNVREDLAVAKQMTAQEERLNRALKEQEKRDKRVADLRETIASLEGRLVLLKEELRQATETADDTTSLV